MKTALTIILLAACTPGALNAAAYREKFHQVLEHYGSRPSDSLKYRAALFLIDNMDGHTAPCGQSVKAYKDSISAMRHFTGGGQLQSMWERVKDRGELRHAPDSLLVDDDYLIDNIDQAFEGWQRSPWHSEVDFQHFCRYVLPFQVSGECLSRRWRQHFRERYSSLLDGVTDMKEAYRLIADSVITSVRFKIAYCPFVLDVISTDHVHMADCAQRSVMLACVLRAFGIPAALDVTPMWSDYGNASHNWVSVVMNDGETYAYDEHDKAVRRHGKIDSSQFGQTYFPTASDHCPYQIKGEKGLLKIYRLEYERQRISGQRAYGICADPFSRDVSAQYALDAVWHVKVSGTAPVYLCGYLSGSNWMPVDMAEPRNGQVTFSHIGENSVCLAARIGPRGLEPTGRPVLLGREGVVREFVPDGQETETVTLWRKYPLCSYLSDQWATLKGCVFEGSMTADFQDADTLAAITTMPYGITSVAVAGRKRYRYLRFRSTDDNRTPLSDLAFYTTDKDGAERLLKGDIISDGIEEGRIRNAFDNDPGTVALTTKAGYWIGLALEEGAASSVSRISFNPKCDLNNIVPGHLYELYCYDGGWRLIGRQMARSDRLVFEKTPKGALLLLKDRTKGHEERIFEYHDNTQIWH